MRGLETGARLQRQPHGLSRLEPAPAPQQIAQRLALDVLHDDARPAALLADVETATMVGWDRRAARRASRRERGLDSAVAARVSASRLRGNGPAGSKSWAH